MGRFFTNINKKMIFENNFFRFLFGQFLLLAFGNKYKFKTQRKHMRVPLILEENYFSVKLVSEFH